MNKVVMRLNFLFALKNTLKILTPIIILNKG
jgi:hypothetical protein